MMRQQLRLDPAAFGELFAQSLCDAAVQDLTPTFEQILISCVLD
jgi:hypothetical protein